MRIFFLFSLVRKLRLEILVRERWRERERERERGGEVGRVREIAGKRCRDADKDTRYGHPLRERENKGEHDREKERKNGRERERER